MVRDVAQHDPTRYDAFGSVPLDELLRAYEARLVERTLVAFRHDQSLASVAGTKDGKPIPVPPLLRILGIMA